MGFGDTVFKQLSDDETFRSIQDYFLEIRKYHSWSENRIQSNHFRESEVFLMTHVTLFKAESNMPF